MKIRLIRLVALVGLVGSAAGTGCEGDEDESVGGGSETGPGGDGPTSSASPATGAASGSGSTSAWSAASSASSGAGGGPQPGAYTRIFHDGFEDGTADSLGQDGERDKCIVVGTALDGVAGPFAGGKMASCNYNGTVLWNDPAAFETLILDTSDYTNELFIRVRLRADLDLDRSCGSPTKVLRFFVQEPSYCDLYGTIWCADGLRNEGVAAGEQMITYWGGRDSAGSSDEWHTVEYYVDHATGAVRVWHDAVLVRDDTFAPGFGGSRWHPLYLASNWADEHDAANHVYFDEIEVFTDSSAGAPSTGDLADASVEPL